MSTTKEHIKQSIDYIDSETQSDEKPRRNSPGTLDQRYIDAYCENPKEGKTAALLKAGYVGDYAPQEAYRLHKRLSDKIKQRYDEMISELDTLAYSNLLSILNKSPDEVGYSNALQAIRAGMDYAGRKPGETLTIKKQESKEDLDLLLERNSQELEQLTGKAH